MPESQQDKQEDGLFLLLLPGLEPQLHPVSPNAVLGQGQAPDFHLSIVLCPHDLPPPTHESRKTWDHKF